MRRLCWYWSDFRETWNWWDWNYTGVNFYLNNTSKLAISTSSLFLIWHSSFLLSRCILFNRKNAIKNNFYINNSDGKELKWGWGDCTSCCTCTHSIFRKKFNETPQNVPLILHLVTTCHHLMIISKMDYKKKLNLENGTKIHKL